MNGNTRIEMNAGGLDGLLSIASFGLSLDGLDKDIENVISSFQAVKNEVYNLPGGVGKLGDFVDAMQCRIDNEEEKRQNLNDFADLFSDFLDLATSVDDAVADFVDQNKEEFYQMNPHLRPPVPQPEKNIFEKAGDWLKEKINDVGEAFVALGTAIYEGIVGAVSAAWEKIKYVFTEFGGLIVTVIGTLIGVVGGILALVFLTGPLCVILGAALLLAGLGCLFAGVTSMISNGSLGSENILSALKGFGIGFGVGLIIGCIITGAGALSKIASKIGSKIGKVLVNGLISAFKNGGTAMAWDVFDQTVMSGKPLSEFELSDFDIKQTLSNGLISAATGFVFGGVEEAFKVFKVGEKLANAKILKPIVDRYTSFKNGVGEFSINILDKFGWKFENPLAAKNIIGSMIDDFGIGFIKEYANEGLKVGMGQEFSGWGNLFLNAIKSGFLEGLDKQMDLRINANGADELLKNNQDVNIVRKLSNELLPVIVPSGALVPVK